MSRSRFLGLLALPVLTAVVTMPASAAMPLDVSDDFAAAIDLWKSDRKQESLDAMRRLLASDPDPQEVYAAYLNADSDVITAFMAEGEEYTQVAARFFERASLGRAELQNDEDTINELVSSYMDTDDTTEGMGILSKIASQHGEYAAPRLINLIGDGSNPDRTTKALVGLTRGIGSRAVLPLIATLDSDNETQRTNAVLGLMTLGDPRAAGALLALAETDESDVIRGAAARAAARCGATGTAVAELTKLGDEFHRGSARVLREYDYSEVVWSWGDRALVGTKVPSAIYNNELSKDAYYRALTVDPTSMDAYAGIARANVDIQAKLAALESAGQDVSDLVASADEGMLAVMGAGPAALDRALGWSVASGDSATGARIAAALGSIATEPTDGLRMALAAGGASMAGEAAVALSHIAVRSQGQVGADVVSALSDAASRRVVKVAVVVDGDAQRAAALIAALDGQDVLGQHAGTGAQGLVMLGQLEGVDAILVGDDLPDLTTDAVIQNIRQNPAFENTPTYLLTANEELADAYGDRIQGSFAGADGIDSLQEVFDAKLDDSRARADALSSRAAGALAALAQTGRGDVGSAVGGLLAAIDGRRDGVAIPALDALQTVGDAGAAGNILAVLANGEASDDVRVAAANALGSIGSRVNLGGDTALALREMLGGDASIAVRSAAARALGGLKDLGGARAEIINAVRVRVGQ